MSVWKKKKYIVTLLLCALVLGLGYYSTQKDSPRKKLVYSEVLDETAATVNGAELTLRDTAFYVAYEEAQIHEMACVYDADNPKRYWNVHVDGIYIRSAARNAAIQMAIHDEIFYQMAMAEGIALSEEEEASLLSVQTDFLADLEEVDGIAKMGVSEPVILECMRKIAYAQKYQAIYAAQNDRDYEDYNYDMPRYGELLEQQDYQIHADVWKRIDFGNITLSCFKIL